MLLLAAMLVVALGYMAVATSKRKMEEKQKADTYSSDVQQIKTQSDNDDLDSIEKDLDNTDTSGVDQDLENIGKELDQ